MTNMVAGGFLKVERDALFSHNGKPVRVRRILSLESVIVQSLDSEETERVRVDQLRSIREVDDVSPASNHIPDLTDFTDADWIKARKIFSIIEPLISDKARSRADVEVVAKNAGVHTATVYEWLKVYATTGHISALVPMQRGPKKGLKLLDSDVESIIEDVIETKYLEVQRLRPSAIIIKIMERCRDLGIKAPHPNTIRNRLTSIPRDKVLRAHGFRDAANKLVKPLLGEFPGADYPLAVVQIDHTRLDIIVVHEQSRKPWGRPWLTIAIDIYTRMIVGIYLSMDAPSFVAVGACLSMGMLPKQDYLTALDVRGRWPVYGKMQLVHSDNGKDFKGANLTRACDEYKIDLQLRPVKTPNYGGHIERLIGNVNREMHKMPGTTFSKPHLREGYDSKKKAALTMNELEPIVVEWIVNQYHQRVHSALGMSPLRKWELAILGDANTPGCGLPLVPPDQERLKIDFLPLEIRTIQNYGVQIDGVGYYDEVLNRWINAVESDNIKEKRKFIFRVDPRKIGKIWFYDPEAKQYFEIHYRNPSHPDVSRAEYREVQRELRQQGFKNVDEDLVFESLKRNRERVELAETETNAAKRSKPKKSAQSSTPKSDNAKQAITAASAEKNNSTSKKSTSPSDDALDDLFDAQVQPIKNVRIGS